MAKRPLPCLFTGLELALLMLNLCTLKGYLKPETLNLKFLLDISVLSKGRVFPYFATLWYIV
jgi:hypothetical protein